MTFVETFWIYIDRQWSQDMMIGPYPTLESAEFADENSVLIASYCEEDCLDAYIVSHLWSEEETRLKGQHQSTFRRSEFKGRDVSLIDPTYWAHNGQPYDPTHPLQLELQGATA